MGKSGPLSSGSDARAGFLSTCWARPDGEGGEDPRKPEVGGSRGRTWSEAESRGGRALEGQTAVAST